MPLWRPACVGAYLQMGTNVREHAMIAVRVIMIFTITPPVCPQAQGEEERRIGPCGCVCIAGSRALRETSLNTYSQSTGLGHHKHSTAQAHSLLNPPLRIFHSQHQGANPKCAVESPPRQTELGYIRNSMQNS